MTCVFVDIGDVLLNDGWDHDARKRAAEFFDIEYASLNDRHHLKVEPFEEGRITLDEYLDFVVFNEKRVFTQDQFRDFMFAQSEPFPEMIEMVSRLRSHHGQKIVAVSNEGRELNAYRIQKFGLASFVDCFISSCFVHIRKPDPDIFKLALDVAQVPVSRIAYVENTPLFVQVAESLGIRTVLHTSYATTCATLTTMGVWKGKGVNHDPI